MATKFKLSLAKIRVFCLVVALVLLSGGIGYRLGQGTLKVTTTKNSVLPTISRQIPAAENNVNMDLFWSVWDKLSANYLDKSKIDQNQMVYGAIKGMVSSVGDPYTMFLPPTDNKKSKEDLNGSFSGVGIELGFNKDKLMTVVSPLKGTPAEKAGVKATDVILKIGDKDTMNMGLQEAVDMIRGLKGTQVKMTLVHLSDNKPYEVTLTRDTILVPSVDLEFKDKIAVIKLSRFGDRTNDEWNKVVDKIIATKDTKGIVLDMRNNPGGYLTGSVYIASEFLPSGVVVEQESSNGVKEPFEVNRKGKLLKQPLVVLVNEGSASASEIVAGALQDHKRAQIVGVTSFGKGTVQEAEDLKQGAGLHVTVARWLTPNGNWIDKNGIKPDVEVKNDPEKPEEDLQLNNALELLKS